MADMTDFSEHTITTGDDAALVLTITRNGAALDLTGMTVTWSAASRHGQAVADLGPYTATLDADPTTGRCVVTIPKGDTVDLPSHAYVFDAHVTDGAGNRVTVVRGLLHVLADVTA